VQLVADDVYLQKERGDQPPALPSHRAKKRWAGQLAKEAMLSKEIAQDRNEFYFVTFVRLIGELMLSPQLATKKLRKFEIWKETKKYNPISFLSAVFSRRFVRRCCGSGPWSVGREPRANTLVCLRTDTESGASTALQASSNRFYMQLLIFRWTLAQKSQLVVGTRFATAVIATSKTFQPLIGLFMVLQIICVSNSFASDPLI